MHAEGFHSHAHMSRPGSSIGHSNAHLHPRPQSRLGHDHPRPISPCSSTSSKSHHEEFGEQHEIEHERQRNRNAPKPKLGISLGISPNGYSPRPVSPTSHSDLQASTSSSHRPVHSKSPGPPAQTSAGNQVDIGREKGWKVAPPYWHERTSSSPSLNPARKGSRPSNSSSLDHTSAPSTSARRTASSPPDQVPGPVVDAKKGHKRTTTELSESMGPFPRHNARPLAVSVPDESSTSLFGPYLFLRLLVLMIDVGSQPTNPCPLPK